MAYVSRRKREQRRRVQIIAACVAGAVLVAGGFWAVVLRPGAAEQARMETVAAELRTATPKPPADLRVVERGDDPLRVLFAGDSLTSGYFASSKDAGFRNLLAEEWGDVELTSADLAHQDLTTVSRIVDVPADLDIAVVELGTNDISAKTPLDDFRSQYVGLLGKILEGSPDAAVVCAGTWQSSVNGRPYNTIIHDECERVGGVYVGLVQAFQDEDNRGPAGVETPFGESDTFHPNDTGHRLIADLIADHIEVR